jgi:ribonuclease VapC
MVIDTSAILAILLEEPEAAYFIHLIGADQCRLFSAVSFVEASIVLSNRKGEAGERKLDEFLQRAKVPIISVDTPQAETTRAAYRKFGKGVHRACLNFGDCFAYALAKTTKESLLFKGNDFALTDVQPAAVD